MLFVRIGIFFKLIKLFNVIFLIGNFCKYNDFFFEEVFYKYYSILVYM